MSEQQTVDRIEFNCPITQRTEQVEITTTYIFRTGHRYEIAGQPINPPKERDKLVTLCSGGDHCKIPLPSKQCRYFKDEIGV